MTYDFTDDKYANGYEAGFRAGVEAAAIAAYKAMLVPPPFPESIVDAILNAIRSLPTPSPEPASDFYKGLGPWPSSVLATAAAPAPGPERCGHQGWRFNRRCDDCGAEWRDEWQEWRGGR